MRQSERGELYDAALAQLDAAGALYPCYCTRAEIREAASAPHGAARRRRLPGHLPGADRRPARRARARRAPAGAAPARRAERRVGFTDRLLGPYEGVVDDLVVRRNDGAPAYNLAVVVDDTAQGVGEVVRGADLIETTPRQLHVAARLGLPAPGLRARPARAGPRRDPPGQAPRRRDARRSHRGRGVARSRCAPCWRAPSASRRAGETPTLDELLTRFDPSTLPTEPTVLAA